MTNVKFFASVIAPNPKEVKYWIDLSLDPYGAAIKYFDGEEWQLIIANAAGSINPANYYTKSQTDKLLNTKANVTEVPFAVIASNNDYPDIRI